MLIESPAFLDFRTGRKNLEILASIKGEIDADRVAESLEEVGLDPYDKRKYRKYSLGMRQRLGLAAAFMEHSRFIILDEPTNALDPDDIDMLKRLLVAEKKTCRAKTICGSTRAKAAKTFPAKTARLSFSKST